MPEMIPTRDGFGKGVLELGQTNSDVVVLCADLTDSTRAGWFREKFPSRFFGFGIAEQDMFGAAAGMALYHGGYVAEVIGGGLLGIDKGQSEAARSLGLPEAVAARARGGAERKRDTAP